MERFTARAEHRYWKSVGEYAVLNTRKDCQLAKQ